MARSRSGCRTACWQEASKDLFDVELYPKQAFLAVGACISIDLRAVRLAPPARPTAKRLVQRPDQEYPMFTTDTLHHGRRTGRFRAIGPGWLASVALLLLALLPAHAPVQAQARTQAAPTGMLLDKNRQAIPPVKAAATGPLSPAVNRALAHASAELRERRFPATVAKVLGSSGDPRLAWYLYDLLRFADGSQLVDLVAAFEKLTGARLPSEPLAAMGDWLLAWDLPAPPGYREMKRDLFLLIEPRWAPFFADTASTIDWRHVGWGGVYIDDRPDATGGQVCPRGCIPALDQPTVTPAGEGSWYPENAIVFGIVVNGEARAYPRNMMEVHEMVNDTLGGRQIGIPYCTLCLSAQAYFTDRVPGFAPLLRTSGLLARSNKLMYDLRSGSAIDTFTGKALSGPMRQAGVTLPQTTVVVTTWGAWRAAHPKTTLLAQDGGLGRSYPLNPLGGRDDRGPIFPVGDVDPRLPVHEVVLGVTNAQGRAIAFARAAAQLALTAGERVRLGGVEVRSEAGGLRAFVGGDEVTSQQAFWFAWSQFKPGTQLWRRGPAS